MAVLLLRRNKHLHHEKNIYHSDHPHVRLATLAQAGTLDYDRQAPAQHLTKSGKPHKRYNENKHLTKAGKTRHAL